MKIFVLISLLSLPFITCAQQKVKEEPTEMDEYDGLLYSDADIHEMKKTTDSLNLRYLECVANPEYYSWPQTQAVSIELRIRKKNADHIRKRLQQDISLQQLLREFPEIRVKDSSDIILAYQRWYNQYEKKYDTILYAGNGNGFNRVSSDMLFLSGGWVYTSDEYNEEREYCDIDVWQLDKPFASTKLPTEYAKMVQYVDCMVDTNTVLMLNKGEPSEEENKSQQALIKFVCSQRKTAVSLHNNLEEHTKYISEEFHKNREIRQLLDNTIKEALEKGNGSDELEALAAGLYSKDTILLMKRSRVVFGQCSMDDSPRRHARDIATLASQTHQWPVFIRAHLDIMNDYFQRMSDGSYAQHRRKTYLRELELLDIPAQRLLLGCVFRAGNLPESHYYGNVNRIGRAFTESGYAADFEKMVKSIMKDEDLDPFNRCLFFMLYTSYCYRQAEESIAKTKIDELKKESAAYPDYIRAGINGL